MNTKTETKDIAELGRRIDDAYERTKIGHTEWIDGSIELAIAHAEARACFRSDNDFGRWRVENGHDHFGGHDCAALVGLGSNPKLARSAFERADMVTYRTIWERERERYDAAAIPETLPPKPQPETSTEPKVKQPNSENKAPEKPAAKKSESKLYKLGDAVADVLLAKFKNPRMLSHFLGGEDKQWKKRGRLLRYLAVRVTANYPEECLSSKSWERRLLYPYLPPKMLDQFAKNIHMINENHAALAATEEAFMKTPECGVTDPPMVAFNKAHSIYQSIIHNKGNDGDRSAHVHKPTFAPDDGKPPVVVRGTQLWPAVSDAGYGYDDLRCAYGMADDVLTAFVGPADASMATKSLKLRHVSAWLPPRGYNSVGATLGGFMLAWAAVVYAYGADKSDMMRSPSPSLRKLGE